MDLLAVQRILKSLLQHHSSKASILWSSAFFTVQLSHPYRTTGKTIAFTRWTFVGKLMSLLLNMLSSLVITFLPRSKRLLISWLPSPSAVILEPPKIKSDTVSTVSPVAMTSQRLCCWEGLGTGGGGDDRGWDGWMASLTRWTWVWVNSGVGDGQGGLACCNLWGRKESNTTEWLNWWLPDFVIWKILF